MVLRLSVQKIIVAHRGKTHPAHENTIEAFEAAAALGCDMFECDVRRSGDGQFVIHHDPDVAGMLIAQHGLRELEEKASSCDYHLPRLEETCKFAQGRIAVNLELKEIGDEVEIVRTVRSFLGDDSFLVTSFNDVSVHLVKKAFPEVSVGLLLGLRDPRRKLRTRISELFPEWRLKSSHADFVVPHFDLLRLGFRGRMGFLGIPIVVWTVNDRTLLTELLNDESILGVITDIPALAMEISGRRQG